MKGHAYIGTPHGTVIIAQIKIWTTWNDLTGLKALGSDEKWVGIEAKQ